VLGSVAGVLHRLGYGVGFSPLDLTLPVGISFYTFQELSYTISVYRGTLRARRNFLDFAVFVCFFPQLVAGPIERAAHLLPQVERPRVWSWAQAQDAFFLILWGYFKKLVVADNAGVIANKVFALQEPGFFVLWAGVFAFAIQIYGDFSAYSDIARGTARWLGFDLMRNFDHPYMARGPVEFWRRWHISLSTWFRDYVYVPLGGSRGGPLSSTTSRDGVGGHKSSGRITTAGVRCANHSMAMPSDTRVTPCPRCILAAAVCSWRPYRNLALARPRSRRSRDEQGASPRSCRQLIGLPWLFRQSAKSIARAHRADRPGGTPAVHQKRQQSPKKRQPTSDPPPDLRA
jgi:hypothetical protein